MRNHRKRWTAACLALALGASLLLPALAEEALEETPPAPGAEEQAQPLRVTVGDYTPSMTGSENIQAGQTYTLVALPISTASTQGDADITTLTPAELLSAGENALFVGSAVASGAGSVTFRDVRLRTAQAVVYYVTGPGLATPLYEATNTSTSASGTIKTDDVANHAAKITLVDASTGYSYGNTVTASAGGAFSFDALAPGTYDMLVTKPGYLPYTRKGEVIEDGKTTLLKQFNLSTENTVSGSTVVPGLNRVGDVNGDGARNMADLAALLLYYGAASTAIPADITADLNGDGAVDQLDASLLITAAGKPSPKDITTGTATSVTGAKLTVSDAGGAAGAPLRYLSFALDASATVSGAAFSLTFPADAVQPLNSNGGLIAPIDGSALASCLTAASGFDLHQVRWSIAGNFMTLTFAVTADSPKAAGEVARFYYRPALGSTDDFYQGVFALTQAAALAGKETVVTDCELTYPGCESAAVTGIDIDQSNTTLAIPASGRTAVLPLSATGRDAQGNTYPDLPGVIWTLSRSDGKSLDGVSVAQGLLTVTSSAVVGTVYVTASRGGIDSDALEVTLENNQSEAYAIYIQKDGANCPVDELTFAAGAAAQVEYTALVTDQYGVALTGQDRPEVSWSLSGAPAGIAVQDGVLACDGTTPAGTYSLRVLAQTGQLQAATRVFLTLAAPPVDVFLSGPQSAVIPAQGSESMVLTYTITALDAQGAPVPLTGDLEPTFAVTPKDQGVDAERDTVTGEYRLTVSAEAQSGSYTLSALVGDVPGTLSVQLMTAEEYEATLPARAALYYDSEPLSGIEFTFPAGSAHTLPFTAQLLNHSGAAIAAQPESWSWSMEPAVAGFTLPATGAEGLLALDADLAVGSYAFDLTATDTDSTLSVSMSVTVTVTPVLAALNLTAPDALVIPTGADLSYTLAVEARNGQNTPIPLPDDLVWSVQVKGGSAAPGGVTVDSGVLTVTPAAVPGNITVTVRSTATGVRASADVTLTPAGQESAKLVLYRTVQIDGKVVQTSAPVTATDTADIREGQNLVVTYTPMLLDQTTGAASPVAAADVKWVGAVKGSFTVDEHAENGVYSAGVTAVYAGQSASASVKVTVYPNIVGLLLDFGTGSTQPPYELSIPERGVKLYPAQLIARILREGETRSVPISQLALDDYDVLMGTSLTGLYAELDKSKGVLNFTVEPSAIQNPTSKPTDGTSDIRYIVLFLDYFPNETLRSDRLALYLTPGASSVTNAMLRQGQGHGTSFSFGTPVADDVLTAPAGTLSDCFAMELRDQYGIPVTDEDVSWTLTVPSALVQDGQRLVSLSEPGSAIESAYPTYASIRRLCISPDAPASDTPYRLTLTAEAAGFSCSATVLLKIEPFPSADDLALTLSGASAITIPMYYSHYNSSTPNTAVKSSSYTATLLTKTGQEMDLSAIGYSLRWSVTNAAGSGASGVTVESVDTTTATVKVDRNALPTGSDDSGKLRLTATLRDSQGAEATAQTALIELNRSPSIPTLMTMRSASNVAISSDSYRIESGGSPVTRDYHFYLLDQYRQEALLADQRTVTWSLENEASSGVTLTTVKDENGVPFARITVRDPGYSVNKTVQLVASIKVDGGTQTVLSKLPLTISIGSSSSSGSGGGGGGGGGGMDDTTTPVATTLSISGNAYLNATYGTATTQTYTCTVRDQNGSVMSVAGSSVSWTASGLTNGMTFNTSTHVLTVPATVPAGVYKVILKATYGNATNSATITVNVSNPTAGDPVSISISGASTVTATQGTATTKAWSATLRDKDNNIVTVGEGKVIWAISTLSNGTVTVTFDATTATLTVPATASPGTLNTTLTAKYGTLTATLPVTVTVNENQAATGTAPTIVPTLTQSGTAASVTLTPTQEQAITGSDATGGTVTIAPTGATGATSTTVTLTAATVQTMARQKGQSLRVQTAQGTVILSPETLIALAGQGGSSVSITLSASGGNLGATFACGYEATTLPGSIILSAPASGNVAVRSDGTVVKKAVVTGGRILSYLPGSIQLKVETRNPAFSDTQSHWARDAIAFTTARELFNGVSATAFAPDITMNRAMIVTVLHRLENTPTPKSTASFSDVPAGTWYTDAVSWANAEGIVQGTGSGYAPNYPVTREQLATILYRYVGTLGISTQKRGSLTSFSDQSKVSSYAKDAMQWAVGVGLINGRTNGTLDPGGNASRAEVSAILQRLITNVLAPSV